MRKLIFNALGQPLYWSDTSTSWFSATKSGPVLSGTASHDSLYGDSAVNVTMKGGQGDDVYYVYSASNKVYEAAGEGVDTINTWMSYTLPANFENLTVTGDKQSATGNAQDNIISGAAGSQTIDGGAGNDVLTGGGGADTFVFTRGNGSDLITDFGKDDKIKLNGYGYTSFDQILSHSTQQGANLKLDLGGGENITFSNVKASDLSASQFGLPVTSVQVKDVLAPTVNTVVAAVTAPTNGVLNALNQPLYYSGESKAWFSATKAGLVLTGSAGNDAMYGDSAVTVTMKGGTGDDIYYLYSASNQAYEAAGQGVDTINTWMSYTLPTNFENLVVTGDGRYAFGNAQDNIISGASGSQTIDGGAGNDVLKGGGGADIFLFTHGNGSDLITDFSSDDKIRLNGYSYSSFEQVLAHTTQQGANLKLDLGGGESIVFANTKAANLSASQFQLSLDRSSLKMTFADEFNSLSLHKGTTGTWDAKFPWAPDSGGSLHTNGELQWYVNPNYAPTASVNPFSVSNGVLSITAAPAPASLSSTLGNYHYTSGVLTSASTFSQTYGYFEIRAEMPHDQGVWPAFWLLPANGKWPPELDVVEMRGQEPNIVNATVHSNSTGSHTLTSFPIKVGSTDGFHNYGVLWDKEHVTWYFDDVAVAQAATPSDMNTPMYMLVNLAVGGVAGTPTDGLKNGSTMKIDYIHAYSLADSTVQSAAHAVANDWHI